MISPKPYPEYRYRWFWYWVFTGRPHPEHVEFCRKESKPVGEKVQAMKTRDETTTWHWVRENLKWLEVSVHFRPFWWRLRAERSRSLVWVILGPISVKVWFVCWSDWKASFRD